jgi:Flp pilus assembly pilin Flp
MLMSLSRLRVDRRGATALEYGIIAAVIVLTLGFAFAPLGGQLATHYYERVNVTVAGAAGDG